MNGHTFVDGWIDQMTSELIERAARGIPEGLGERLREEWLADSLEQPGRLARLRFALGCYWAATVIQHEPIELPIAQLAAPAPRTALPAPVYRGPSFHAKCEAAASTAGAGICDINITPLIDVMLVLLVTLILTLPSMTHAVKLVLPQP